MGNLCRVSIGAIRYNGKWQAQRDTLRQGVCRPRIRLLSVPACLMSTGLLSSAFIREVARDLGFDFCRVTAPHAGAVHMDHYRQWLAAGYHGNMSYLARNLDLRANPRHLQHTDGLQVNSVVVVGVDYHQYTLPPAILQDPARGIIAQYAWRPDYHDIVKPLLYELDAAIRRRSGRTRWARGWVDTGPVIERDWAMAAGMTFTGKNCCAIHPRRGSWLFLAVLCIPETVKSDPAPIVLDSVPRAPAAIMAGLSPDESLGQWLLQDDDTGLPVTATCGRCTRCLDQCPTGAFAGPFVLDARKCISYWTIEARTAVPPSLRPHFGNLIFGCDICQDVCPWNRHLSERQPRIRALQAQAAWTAPHLLEGFSPDTPYWTSDEAFRAHFRHSPVKRPKRTGMLRNVCTALGNWGAVDTLPALALALADSSPVVRRHAAWAAGRVLARTRAPEASSLLRAAQARESHNEVQEELACARQPG